MIFRKRKKNLLKTQDDLNSRLLRANSALMSQMETQQQEDTDTVLRQQEKQAQLLRKLMGD